MNYYYCECFCLVNYGLFSCTDKKIFLVLYVSVVFSDYLAVLSTFSNAMSISTAIVTTFLNDSLRLKFGFFSRYLKLE